MEQDLDGDKLPIQAEDVRVLLKAAETHGEPWPEMAYPARGGGWWCLYEDGLDRLVADYPGLDVDHECRLAWAWLDANPDRRKTSRGMPRFLNNWMLRSRSNNGRKTDRPGWRQD